MYQRMPAGAAVMNGVSMSKKLVEGKGSMLFLASIPSTSTMMIYFLCTTMTIKSPLHAWLAHLTLSTTALIFCGPILIWHRMARSRHSGSVILARKLQELTRRPYRVQQQTRGLNRGAEVAFTKAAGARYQLSGRQLIPSQPRSMALVPATPMASPKIGGLPTRVSGRAMVTKRAIRPTSTTIPMAGQRVVLQGYPPPLLLLPGLQRSLPPKRMWASSLIAEARGSSASTPSQRRCDFLSRSLVMAAVQSMGTTTTGMLIPQMKGSTNEVKELHRIWQSMIVPVLL